MEFQSLRPFDPSCARCPRLAEFLHEGKRSHPTYHCAPVPSFGASKARLLIVGLAPGFHGANQTGRPFTGDYAGILLYQTLHRFGWASKPESKPGDDLRLVEARLTNAVRCVPPHNKPIGSEVNECNAYLSWELAQLAPGSAVLSLGVVSHGAVLKALGLKVSAAKFAHNAAHPLPGAQRLQLFDSYHCSRYNTNTRRLTEAMFVEVFEGIEGYLKGGRG